MLIRSTGLAPPWETDGGSRSMPRSPQTTPAFPSTTRKRLSPAKPPRTPQPGVYASSRPFPDTQQLSEAGTCGISPSVKNCRGWTSLTIELGVVGLLLTFTMPTRDQGVKHALPIYSPRIAASGCPPRDPSAPLRRPRAHWSLHTAGGGVLAVLVPTNGGIWPSIQGKASGHQPSPAIAG